MTEHWIGAWSASQVPAWDTVDWDGGISQKGFSDQTIRMTIHPNASGSAIRIRLSNTYGQAPLTFGKVTLAKAAEGAEVVPGSIKRLTFDGKESVTIPVGEQVSSDPIPFEVVDGKNLTISVYVPESTGPVTWHNTSNQTSYISVEGDFTEESTSRGYEDSFDAWFWLSGVDVKVEASEKPRVIVALGDSITDGYLSTLNENRRWTDVLNDRLNNKFPEQTFSILNHGISGNRILTDSPTFGEKALARLERDVFMQTGVTDLVLFEGINDIGQHPHVFEAEKIIAGITEIITKAKKRGMRVFVGTLGPFKAYDDGVFYTDEGEHTRQEVNKWIRNNTISDGVIDFDKALRDPSNPDKILPEYDSGDELHPSDEGLKAMAESIDLSIFG